MALKLRFIICYAQRTGCPPNPSAIELSVQVSALVVAGFLLLANETAERSEAAALCLYLLLRTHAAHAQWMGHEAELRVCHRLAPPQGGYKIVAWRFGHSVV